MRLCFRKPLLLMRHKVAPLRGKTKLVPSRLFSSSVHLRFSNILENYSRRDNIAFANNFKFTNSIFQIRDFSSKTKTKEKKEKEKEKDEDFEIPKKPSKEEVKLIAKEEAKTEKVTKLMESYLERMKPSDKPLHFDEGIAPTMLLAKSWESKIDPTGWWMSEKLDGVRAIWNGKQFISRLGNAFTPPAWFIEALAKHAPNMCFDGELWVGRSQFQTTVSIVKTVDDQNEEWKKLVYNIFDVPSLEKPFEERIEALKEFLKKIKEKPGSQYLGMVEHIRCENVEHLKKKQKEVEDMGGEGLMLRQPGSYYAGDRSSSLLKVKTFSDMEGKIIGYDDGRGKYTGKVGALVIELANGKKFSVGSGLNDKERENPPKIGTVICFQFQGLTSDGIPRFPTYLGERVDVKVTTPEEKEKQKEEEKGQKKTRKKKNGEESKSTSNNTSITTSITTSTPPATTSASITSTPIVSHKSEKQETHKVVEKSPQSSTSKSAKVPETPRVSESSKKEKKIKTETKVETKTEVHAKHKTSEKVETKKEKKSEEKSKLNSEKSKPKKEIDKKEVTPKKSKKSS